MPKINFSHLCDYAFLSDSGKVNILGIFKNINSTTFPYRHPQMYVVVNATFEDAGNYSEKIQLVDVDNNVISNLDYTFSVPSKVESGVIGQFIGTEFKVPGTYKLQVLIDGRVEIEVPLTVTKISTS